jgi:hypothetical protein
MTVWQDSWTFRIVDQDTGAAVPGVPVSVLESSGQSSGYWVSDRDGLVRIPKHDRPRLRIRVGLRNEEAIELDARSLPDDPIPLTAPRDFSVPGTATASPAADAPSPLPPPPSPAIVAAAHAEPGHVMRFARIGVLPQDRDITDAQSADPDPTSMRYGVLLEIELVWQSLGAQAGATIYSLSLGPGEEVKLAVSDGRWRKWPPDTRGRPLQIVARMVGARQMGDGMDAVPLDACVASDLPSAVADTVSFLAERTARSCEALRRRALSVTELDGEKPANASLRTLRNMRSEGVLTYHFVEPIERHRIVVRTPRLRAALLVPFRLPNLATRAVVQRFGHVLRRNLLDRDLGADIDQVLAADAVPVSTAVERRLYAHIAAHLPYYSATIIASDAAERFLALAKLRDPGGRPLTDVIENIVVDRVGNYVAFPLRADFTTPEWREALGGASSAAQLARASREFSVALPIPGLWLRSELFPAQLATDGDAGAEDVKTEERTERRKRR